MIQLRYRYGSRGPAEADEQAVKNNFIYTGRYNIPSAKVYNKVTFIWKYNQKGTWNLNLLNAIAQVQVDTSHKCSKQVVGPLTHWGRDFSKERKIWKSTTICCPYVEEKEAIETIWYPCLHQGLGSRSSETLTLKPCCILIMLTLLMKYKWD